MLGPRSLVYLATASLLGSMASTARTQTVDSESAIVIDSVSGKILWSRNANEELYPASTTKIMTALLLLEHCKPDEIIEAPTDVQTVKEASMHLKPGEQVRATDMLYALMLRSANDGCYAVANHISGSVAKFSDLMNERAKQIGCTHTHFDNPNGLNDKLHYTSAHDLALIAREAMKHPEFRDIVKTERTKINRGVNWKDLWMVNHDRLLKRDPTCDGIKTGWTIPAGHCFVGSATREGWRVITVVMKSKSWENDTEALFNWAFATYGMTEEVRAGQVVGTLAVHDGERPTVPLVANEEAYTLVKKADEQRAATGYRNAEPALVAPPAERSFQVPPFLAAPVVPNKPIGRLLLKDSDGFVQSVDVSPGQPVMTKPKLASVVPPAGRANFVIAAGLLVGAFYVRGRSRRRFHRLFK